MATVNPDETPSEDTQLGSASSAPSTRSASPAPSSNNPPSSPNPSSSSSRHNTPTLRKRKRTDSQRILDFLQAVGQGTEKTRGVRGEDFALFKSLRDDGGKAVASLLLCGCLGKHVVLF
uniref:Uncharacterized protein n=1 Tax=Knipowitschia caucasica TaxID=637954 RepID=A0AAV2MHW1_KNICA